MVATSSTSSAMLVALTSTVILPRLSSADAATAAGSLNADFNIGQFLTQLHNNDDTPIHAALNNDLNDNGEADIDTSFGMFNTNVSLHDAAYAVNDTTVYHHQQQQQHQQYAATPILSASSSWRSQNDDVDSHLISARESKSEIEINSESEGMVLELELPKELADLIANAQSTTTPQQEKEESETTKAAVRYYATYSENELCSSKSTSKFELWEESYESLKECCEANFSWEFDSCVGTL